MPRALHPFALAAAISGVMLGCARPVPTPVPGVPENGLQSIIDHVVAEDEGIHGAALAVISPSIDLAWEGAAGLADPENGTPMTPDNPVQAKH